MPKCGAAISTTDEWPESLAGPEYWLYKKQQGDDE